MGGGVPALPWPWELEEAWGSWPGWREALWVSAQLLSLTSQGSVEQAVLGGVLRGGLGAPQPGRLSPRADP